MTVIEFLDLHSVPYDVSGRGKNHRGWANIRCGECGRDPYLGLHLARLYAFCWSCGYQRIGDALSAAAGVPVREVLAALGIDGGARTTHHAERPERVTGRLELPHGVTDFYSAHSDYLAGRCLSPKAVAATWGVRGIGPLGGKLSWRLFIPVHQAGKVVTWTTRSLRDDDHGRRYRSAPLAQSDVPIDECVYGLDLVGWSTVLCEGPADVWKLGPGATALMRMDPTPKQLEQLAKVPRVAVCLDMEPEAQDKARRLVADLRVLGCLAVNLVLETGKDPGAAEESEVMEIRRRFLE